MNYLDELARRQQAQKAQEMTHGEFQQGEAAEAMADYFSRVLSGQVASDGLDKYAKMLLPQSYEQIKKGEKMPTIDPALIGDMIPGGGVAGTIGGKVAKTADLLALGRAQKMKEAGAGTDDIYKETKWWLDHPDGQPRFEIDDSRYFFDPSKLVEDMSANGYYKVGRAGDAMRHDKLTDAYPQLNDTTMAAYPWRAEGGAQGKYSPGMNHISLFDANRRTASSTALHEAQHKAQEVENFAKGGSSEMFSPGLNPTWKENPKDAARLNALISSTEYKRELALAQDSFEPFGRKIDELDALNDAGKLPDDEWDRLTNKVFEDFDTWKSVNLPAIDEIDVLSKRLGKKVISPDEQYRRLAGESEARLVQDRMSMSMKERLENPFYKKYDVPIDEQILIGLLK